MRVVVQRVSEAKVTVAGETCGQIAAGLLLLVGVEEVDTQQDIDWLVRKISQLRIFSDADGVMNRSVLDCVQRRWRSASSPCLPPPFGTRLRAGSGAGDISRPLFEQFVASLAQVLGKAVPTGLFGADMQVSLVNDGPVTILLDSREPE
jgi:D-tyrosyl-tRNA(Tyr) deacylase